MTYRPVIRVRLEFIEARVVDLKWRVEIGTASRQDIVWSLEKLEKLVRNAHADFVEEELR